MVVTDPVALANGAYLFFAYQPGDSLSRTPLLDLYWEDIAGQPLQDIPIPTFSAIDVGGPPGAKASGDTVVVRKQTLWGCTVNFTFYAADTLISFADLTGDIRRHSSRIQLVNPHPTMQLLSWWKPPFQQGYRALYEGLLETQSILRKIVYLRTDLFCGEAISLQEFNIFDPDRACCFGLRGNVNGEIDNMVDVADLTYLVDYLFRGGFAPPCFDEADYNASGGVDVADLGSIVDYLFRGGPPPGFCP